MNQKDESKVKTPSQPATVAATPQQAGDTRDPWWWVERSVWTERMLTRLTTGESADRVWFRMVDKTYGPSNLSQTRSADSPVVSRVNMRSVQTLRSTHHHGSR